MKKILLINLLMLFNLVAFAQGPQVVNPLDGAVNVPVRSFVDVISTSRGNSNRNPDNIYLQVSNSPDFSNPLWFGPFIKKTNNDVTYSFNLNFSSDFMFYVRGFSTKQGFGDAISFTTAPSDNVMGITAPENNATNVDINTPIELTTSSTGNSNNNPENLYIVLNENRNFTGDFILSDLFIRKTNATVTYRHQFDLEYSTVYYARPFSSNLRFGNVITFSTANRPVELETINGVEINANRYANDANYVLSATNIEGATLYTWEFDDDPNFGSIDLRTTSTTNELTLSPSDLLSGERYYTRVVTTVNNLLGDLTTAKSNFFYNALHISTLVAPHSGETINRTSFKVWVEEVKNSDDIIFQIDDNEDFSSPFENNFVPIMRFNNTVEGVEGNVFTYNKSWYENSGFRVSQNEVLFRVLDYVGFLENQTTYYVRTRSSNENQSGYWSPTYSFFVDAPVARETTTDLEDIESTSVYPTEFTGSTTLAIDDLPGLTNVSIYTAKGQIVESFSTTPGQIMQVGSNLENGSYIIKVTSDLTSDSFRVTKF